MKANVMWGGGHQICPLTTCVLLFILFLLFLSSRAFLGFRSGKEKEERREKKKKLQLFPQGNVRVAQEAR